MNFRGVFHNGGFNFGAKREEVIAYSKKHNGERFEIIPYLPESRKMRGFYEGGVIPLWAYLDGNDYHDTDVIRHYHNEANKEFNGEFIHRAGKSEKMARSSKGQLRRLIEEVITYLEENYGIDRTTALDPEHFKDFRDRVRFDGEFDHYIDYQRALKRIPNVVPRH